MVTKQAVDAKVKAARQAFLLAQKSDARYHNSYKPLKNKKFKEQKDSKVKKNYYLLVTNSNDRNVGQSGQTFNWSFKKNVCLNKRS